MKKSRGFSLSRTLQRVRELGNLLPRRWWPSSSDCNWEQTSDDSAAAQYDNATVADVDSDLMQYARLDHCDSTRSLSFVIREQDHGTTTQPQPQLPKPASFPAKMATLKLLFGSPSTVLARLKQSCRTLREETANLSGLSVSELFVGNQMLMHVSAMPVAGRKRILAMPSKGFSEPERTPQIIAPIAAHNITTNCTEPS